MKLRIKGDSVRFRVPPSGVKRLLAAGRLDGCVRFSLHPFRALHYSLVLDEDVVEPALAFEESQIIARLPKDEAVRWATTDSVSLGGRMQLNESSHLNLLIEKDFACLDLSDEDNRDTFPNPNAGQAC